MAERNDRDTASMDSDRSREARDTGGRAGTPGARPAGTKSNRGFASMDPQRQREIASKGGRAAHEKGTAHEWTPDEAREAGRKGGEMVSRDRAHMAAIGREGGGARSNRNRQSGSQPAVRENAEGGESTSESTTP
jgi:general stress protein YciG